MCKKGLPAAPSKKILIVEDNFINRQILREILEQEHEPIEAENGQQALEMLEQYGEEVILILLDIIMPVMDGYAFLSIIKEHPLYSSIPVIVATSSNSEEDEVNALARGATDFISKPYRRNIVQHRVNSIIKLRETAAIVNLIKYDQLTGVYGKEYFYKMAADEIRKNPHLSYDIICSDIENFSLINDMFSYTTGNELLRLTASVLSQSFGGNHLCGRMSADSFAILIERKADYNDTFFDEPMNELNKLFPRTRLRLDFGIYPIDDINISIQTACDRAMSAIETIKGKFTHNFAIYDDHFRKQKLYDQAIIDNMEKALAQKEFLIYYQPKYHLKSGAIIGAEALVRWFSPTEGLRPPGHFIPLFEKNGFITELDKYVWNGSCRFMRRCIDEGIQLVPISVNVSRTDLFNPELPEIILNIVKHHQLEPSNLHLEITESAYTDRPELIIEMASQLRDSGFVIEMDDFGSGYSSLNMLSTMPIDVLKLDMKFVQNNIMQSDQKSILNFIIELAKWMNLEITAEGIEELRQAQSLRDMDCDQAQGFYFSKPLPEEEFIRLLKDGRKIIID